MNEQLLKSGERINSSLDIKIVKIGVFSYSVDNSPVSFSSFSLKMGW